MKESIRKELVEFIETSMEDNKQTLEEFERDPTELHHQLFNLDYYIIGYYNAEQWLNNHNLSPFRAIEICVDYELEHFGETTADRYNNAESCVNMLAYIFGEELIHNMYSEL